jgi:hypothetical protein
MGRRLGKQQGRKEERILKFKKDTQTEEGNYFVYHL